MINVINPRHSEISVSTERCSSINGLDPSSKLEVFVRNLKKTFKGPCQYIKALVQDVKAVFDSTHKGNSFLDALNLDRTKFLNRLKGFGFKHPILAGLGVAAIVFTLPFAFVPLGITVGAALAAGLSIGVVAGLVLTGQLV